MDFTKFLLKWLYAVDMYIRNVVGVLSDIGRINLSSGHKRGKGKEVEEEASRAAFQ